MSVHPCLSHILSKTMPYTKMVDSEIFLFERQPWENNYFFYCENIGTGYVDQWRKI